MHNFSVLALDFISFVFPVNFAAMVSAVTKGKFLKGMKKLIKKNKAVVNVTSANLKQQVLKQGTGKMCYFSFDSSESFAALPAAAVPTWSVRCISAPFNWSQVFDITVDTFDRQFPRVSLKSMDIGVTIMLERAGVARTVYVWVVSMKKDLQAYVNGNDFTAANMVNDQSFIHSGESVHLNPEFFDIKKSWVAQLGAYTTAAGAPTNGAVTTEIRDRKMQVRHRFKTDWVFSDSSAGWKVLQEQDLNISRRWYLICATSSLYGADESICSIYQSTLCKIVY